MSVRGRVLVTAAAAVLAPAAALAQQTSPELVDILARSVLPRQDSVQVVEGALPAAWAARVPLPAGMRFLGAVVGRSAVTAYLVSAASPGTARDMARAAARAAGFVDAPEPPAFPSGFVTQRPAAGTGPLCRGTLEELRIATRPQLSGALLTVAYRSEPTYECASPRPSRPDPYAALPKLQPPPLPPGALPGGCYGGRSSGTTDAEVVSTLDLAGVLRFYGGQLEAAGWQRAPGDSAAAGTWRKTTGVDTATATLVVSGRPGTSAGCRRLELRLEETAPPR